MTQPLPSKQTSPLCDGKTVVLVVLFALMLAGLIAGEAVNIAAYVRGTLERAEFTRRTLFAFGCIAAIGAVFLIERLFRFRFPYAIRVALPLFLYGAIACATVFDFYSFVWEWDKILHTLSGVLFALLGVVLAQLLIGDKMSGGRKAAVCLLIGFLIALAEGYLWELWEFLLDSISPANAYQSWDEGLLEALPDGTFLMSTHRGSAIVDSMLDMLVNFLGALVTVAVLAPLFVKKPGRIEAFKLKRVPKKARPARESGEEK